MSDLEFEFAATALKPLSDEVLGTLDEVFAELHERAVAVLEQQGVPEEAREYLRTLDIRYRGQEHALPVEYQEGASAAEVLAAFNERHVTLHGHAMEEPGQILSLRLKAVGVQPKPPLVRIAATDGAAPEPVGVRSAFDVATDSWRDFAVHERDRLRAGDVIAGPAIVEEGTSTTVFFGDQTLTVDEYGHLAISRLDATIPNGGGAR
nr:hypothetical protein [Rathayibacter sp. VKM Ac-2835]